MPQIKQAIQACTLGNEIFSLLQQDLLSLFKPQCRLVGETKVWFLTFQCDSMIYSNNTVPYSSQISFVYLSHLIAFRKPTPSTAA